MKDNHTIGKKWLVDVEPGDYDLTMKVSFWNGYANNTAVYIDKVRVQSDIASGIKIQ